MIKLAIVGSRAYTNEERIKKVILKYVARYKDVVIISGGCPNGADYLAKKIALELGLKYIEFPPQHSKHNQYCINSPECYNKIYHVSNYFTRNAQIAEYCEHLLAFVVKGVKSNGTMDTFTKAKNLGKIVVKIED